MAAKKFSCLFILRFSLYGFPPPLSLSHCNFWRRFNFADNRKVGANSKADYEMAAI